MKLMNSISAIIPCFNDAESLPETIRTAKAVLSKIPGEHEIIVVNDGSTDTTQAVLEKQISIKAIHNPYNLGYGASLKRGIRAAKNPWIFITDADGTYPIEKLTDFVPKMDAYDMIIGSRTTENNHTPLLRKPAKWFLNHFASFIAGRAIPDLNSGMRLFKRDLALEFWGLYPKRFSFTSTITMSFIKNDYPIAYIPIDYGKRTGSSSIRAWNFITFLALIFRLGFSFNPLRFLAPAILFLSATGLLKGTIDFVNEGHIGNLAVILLGSGIQLMVLALIADLIAKRLPAHRRGI